MNDCCARTAFTRAHESVRVSSSSVTFQLKPTTVGAITCNTEIQFRILVLNTATGQPFTDFRDKYVPWCTFSPDFRFFCSFIILLTTSSRDTLPTV